MMPSVLTDELAAVLRAVALADFCEPSTIAKVIGHAVAEQLEQLRAAGLVMRNVARRADRTRTTLYTATAIGRDQLRAHEINSAPRLRAPTGMPTVAAPRTAQLTTRGLYTGAELRPYEGRPGAMDAFALPSRMGRRLHYRDGRVQELCAVVGVDVGADRLTFGPVTIYHGSPPCAGFAHPVSGRTEIEA
jgi:hypothetical protein